MSSEVTFPAIRAQIPPRFLQSDAENIELINKRDAVIRRVGYPKIQELSELFSEEIRGSHKMTYPYAKREICQKIGQDAFDEYQKVANDEKVAYVCLLVYFEMFKESYPNLSARALEISWNMVGGQDFDTKWIG